MLTHGPGTDGRYRVALDGKVIATFGNAERARSHAEAEAKRRGEKVGRSYFTKLNGRIIERRRDTSARTERVKQLVETGEVEHDKAAAKADQGRAVDLSVLDQSIRGLEDQLATGELDWCLDQLITAERNGKTRKGALRVLTARLER